MNEYELLYVISPRLSADDVDGMVERVGALIEDAGGSVSMVDNWGRRRLAYPIRHHFEGTYVLTYLNMPGERAAEFERALNINEDVLRHLLISGVIPGYEGPPEQEVDMRRPTGGGRPSFEDRPPADAPPAEAAADAPAEAAEGAPAEGAPAEGAETPTTEAAPASAEAPAAESPPAAEAPAAEAAPTGATEAPAEGAAPAESEAPPAAVAGTE